MPQSLICPWASDGNRLMRGGYCADHYAIRLGLRHSRQVWVQGVDMSTMIGKCKDAIEQFTLLGART